MRILNCKQVNGRTGTWQYDHIAITIEKSHYTVYLVYIITEIAVDLCCLLDEELLTNY